MTKLTADCPHTPDGRLCAVCETAFVDASIAQFKAEQASKEADEEVKLAAAKAAAVEGLPPLEGSPKQIAWAQDIRASRLGVFALWVAERGKPNGWLTPEGTDFVEKIKAKKSAKWWIEFRHENHIDTLIEDLDENLWLVE